MGIPTLPKREVPEVGYREIRDWVINHLGDELDGEKTTSEIVIELLEKASEGLKRADELLSKYDPDCRERAISKLKSLPSFPDSPLAASVFPGNSKDD